MPKSIQEYLKAPYARILIPDEEGGYSAEILEFPGCFAQGETAEETMQALDRAAESWIQAALDQGQEIPTPFTNQGYSGKIALRLPRSLHRKAMQFAERDGTSLNQFLVSAIAARVGVEEAHERLATQLLKKLEDQLSTTVNYIANSTLNFWSERASSLQTMPLPIQNVWLDQKGVTIHG
ncbi:MAG TPA: type II toxin-antitoxin system HicB family antitoxin [Candidatus Tectomicrobia bacterium]|jgi:predicted RNase H-like HicB family nuclease